LPSEYVQHNPIWDEEQTSWKVEKIVMLLTAYDLKPQAVCEVGCGSGGIPPGE
jgi:hypothetical protein